MKFSVFQVSRRGGRPTNEDRMGYCYTRDAALFLLADGMGGHPEGEVAAQLALQVVSAAFQQETKYGPIKDVRAFLAASVLLAHRQILAYAATRHMIDTPRTTFVAALVQKDSVCWVHCGDSRLYMVRDNEMLARTRDHSYMEQRQSEVPRGAKIGEKTNRNVLFTCLGSPANPVFDVMGPVQMQQGDRLMLCSDGLWSALSDELIVQEIARRPVSQSVPELVEQALTRAGASSDNVTVIAMEWEMPNEFVESETSVSTDSINGGVFASTVQAGAGDAGLADDLDDAAIERSIAEINEAIRRTAAKRNG